MRQREWRALLMATWVLLPFCRGNAKATPPPPPCNRGKTMTVPAQREPHTVRQCAHNCQRGSGPLSPCGVISFLELRQIAVASALACGSVQCAAQVWLCKIYYARTVIPFDCKSKNQYDQNLQPPRRFRTLARRNFFTLSQTTPTCGSKHAESSHR